MKQKILIIIVLFLLPVVTFGQIERTNRPALRGMGAEQQEPSQRKKEAGPEPAPVSEYKIISVDNDTTFVDTSLTIHKDYKFNYLRKDNFELLPFSNVGQTYNKLVYDFTEGDHLLPQFGARARHYNFMEVDDIYYYHVPTPFTELYFKTVFEQGQTLDSFFTINTSEDLNFSIAYKGLRSLGKYQHMLVSTGNFRTTVSYNTPNDRYHLRTHFVSQDLMNEENGGLTARSLENYISKDPEFDDRSRLDVMFEDAESTLYGKRFYLDHSFALGSMGPATRTGFSIGHKLNYTYKKFEFRQATANDLFGPSFEEVGIHDETRLESVYNEGFLEYTSEALGQLKFRSGFTHYNYGYETVLDLESGFIENRLIGDVLSAGASYSNNLGGFDLVADGMLNIAGDMDGYDLEGQLSYTLSDELWAAVAVDVNDRAPNWNFLLYQSDYINYNWQNDFSNVNTQGLKFRLLAPNWVNVEAAYTRVGNYTYFAADDMGFIKPFQDGGQLNYGKVKVARDFDFGKFALANTLLFQKVFEGEDVLNVPSFITRNSFYYQDHWFKKALYLQTGFTANYFHNYEMNAYDPVLAEFYVQNDREFEGLRSVDFFFNGKIRQARIFFKLERLDALLLGNNNFAAPSYPYRDFAVRFGLVWNFFM
ncbi:Putative porin [Salinimicrobium catena]|uniref:Putative porin n=1 Tax=Salinimicrobium catena TaxID=390640 RepID=A0A1H5K1D2_9FLAO|nr:putative porin [Salinimicrobium catena]SDK92808.1 Putative porin [Salinimicrobium catena]SEE58555.1 Putative porin [Salinimicrobium catena]